MIKNKRVCIVSDGSAVGTKILDENNQPLELGSIQSIEWSVDVETRMPVATVVTKFYEAAVDLKLTSNG